MSDLQSAFELIAKGLEVGDKRARYAARALRSETPRDRPLKDTANALGEIQSLAIELGDEDEAVRRVALSVPANKREAAMFYSSRAGFDDEVGDLNDKHKG